MSSAAEPTPSTEARLREHVRRLSGLQVKLLLGFLVLGVIGLAGVAWSWTYPSTTTAVIHRPDSARGFAGNTPEQTATTTTETDQSWTGWFSGHGVKLGFGFVGGFILGFIFRAFLKIMTLLAILIGGGLAALSYFNLLHVDLTAAHNAWNSNSDWIMTEAGKLKDAVVAHLPSSTTGAAGVFMGLRRK